MKEPTRLGCCFSPPSLIGPEVRSGGPECVPPRQKWRKILPAERSCSDPDWPSAGGHSRPGTTARPRTTSTQKPASSALVELPGSDSGVLSALDGLAHGLLFLAAVDPHVRPHGKRWLLWSALALVALAGLGWLAAPSPIASKVRREASPSARWLRAETSRTWHCAFSTARWSSHGMRGREAAPIATPFLRAEEIVVSVERRGFGLRNTVRVVAPR